MEQSQSFNFHPLNPERVIVNRGNGQTFEAVTTHQLFSELVKGGKVIGRGESLGVGVMDDRGFHLYAQPDQIKPVEAA